MANQLVLPADTKARYIIAANHQSRLDAFVIAGIIGPRYWRQLLPYRYITANQYLYNWRTGWILWPLGGFPAFSKKRGTSGLKRAGQIFDLGQTIGIFPEGRRSRPRTVRPKNGVAVLADLPHAYIIPINVQWRHGPRRVKITVGAAYRPKQPSAEKILDTIYTLAEAV